MSSRNAEASIPSLIPQSQRVQNNAPNFRTTSSYPTTFPEPASYLFRLKEATMNCNALLTLVTMVALIACAPQNTAPQNTAPKDNKNIVLALVQGLNKNDKAVINALVAEDFIQHDPNVADGRDGLIAGLGDNPVSYDIKRVFSENDRVVLHSRVTLGGQAFAAFDVFRVRNGLVVEHWDAFQADPDKPGVSGHTLLDGATEVSDVEKTADNKATARSFYENLFVKGKPQPALALISPSSYTQHNPMVGDGLKGLMDALQGFAGPPPSSTQPANTQPANTQTAPPLEIRAVTGEGNFVLLQSAADFMGNKAVVYDLFRLKDGLLVEHWDISQPVPATPKNKNGML